MAGISTRQSMLCSKVFAALLDSDDSLVLIPAVMVILLCSKGRLSLSCQ